jgi:hypothetical protein
MVAAPVCAPWFMVALAGEFYKFTKDMTESPVVLPVMPSSAIVSEIFKLPREKRKKDSLKI